MLPLREGGRQVEWVISRGLSLYLTVACAAVPRKRRDAFVNTAIRRAAPFADPAWHVAWSGDLAMVWVWPQEELLATDDEPSLDHLGVPADEGPVRVIRRFLPESLLRGEARENGVELLECSDGIEARAWRQGALYASNWWLHVPDALAWTAFCRGAGVASHEAPEVQRLPWRDNPWTVVRGTSLRDTLSQYQRLTVPVAVALILLVAAYQAGSILHLEWARMQLDAEIAASSQKVSDILAARNRAEDDLVATRLLLAFRPPAPQVRLMATVATTLDKLHAKVVQWSMPNPTNLELLVSMDSPDPRALVLAFQHIDAFDDVSADVGQGGKDRVIIRVRVKPATSASPNPPATTATREDDAS